MGSAVAAAHVSGAGCVMGRRPCAASVHVSCAIPACSLCCPTPHLADEGGVGVQVGQLGQLVVAWQGTQPVKQLCRKVEWRGARGMRGCNTRPRQPNHALGGGAVQWHTRMCQCAGQQASLGGMGSAWAQYGLSMGSESAPNSPDARCGWPDFDSSLSSAATARESRLYRPSRTASMTGCPGLSRCREGLGPGRGHE